MSNILEATGPTAHIAETLIAAPDNRLLNTLAGGNTAGVSGQAVRLITLNIQTATGGVVRLCRHDTGAPISQRTLAAGGTWQLGWASCGWLETPSGVGLSIGAAAADLEINMTVQFIKK